MKLKSKLAARNLTIGSWLTIAHPIMAEIMSSLGFEWIVVDMEHPPITITEVFQMVQIIELSGCVSLVRISENNATIIKQVLDSGTQGIIVPMVNNAEEAENAVKAARYAPLGVRGVGLTRANKYGDDFDNYRKRTNEIIVLPQIEHIKAVYNLEEIIRVDGVDGIIVGPYDLSASLGFPGEFDHPEVRTALKKIEEIIAKMKISAGYHIAYPNISVVKEKMKNYNFIIYSADFLLMREQALNDLKK